MYFFEVGVAGQLVKTLTYMKLWVQCLVLIGGKFRKSNLEGHREYMENGQTLEGHRE